METVYISAGISAGMLYGYICGQQMLKYIQRDGCTIETIINCVFTPFMPIIAPLLLGGDYIFTYVKRSIYGREDEESQNNQTRFEGLQEKTNNEAD